ncbi:MAG: SdrD B-like domain-containing protein [Chloroflexia bacterium]
MEALYRVYVDPALSNDYAVGRLYQGTTELANITFTTAQLNNFVGRSNAGYLTWTIPGSSAPGGSWTWDDFALLTLHLEPEKSGAADPSTLYIDAIGFRITVSGECPAVDPNDIMVTVPLTDTYDTTYLQFLSADPPQTAVNTSTGVITWTNVGPIYPGEARIVTVRFLARPISGTSSQTVNNAAGSTGTRFADGGYANDVHDTASGTICQTGSINGYVYSDPDSSGWNYSPGAGDLPIPGVRVTLYGCYNKTTGELITSPNNSNKACTDSQNNGEWRAVSTQVTDANGYYAFTGLLNGFYYVQVTGADIPGTVSQTAEANDNQSAGGTLPNTTANGHTCGQPGGTCDSTWGNPAANLNTTYFNPINSAGETINGVNFGYNIQAGAYGSVWEDNNGDGDRDSGEGPIGSVTVRLYTGSCGGTLVASTTTDANGRYRFGNLTAGTTYYIAVDTSTLPGGASAWTQTGESDGSINNCISFTAQAGALSGSHDFGFRKTGSYTLGDTLYYDWDGDGTQDSNEEGIPNVTVSLYEDANGNGSIDPEDALISTTVTSGSGYYRFTGLPAGSYLVAVDTNDPDFPAGVVETQDPDESGVCVVCDSRGGATLGPSDDTVDFGYRPLGAGSIGDTVFRDMNGDGVQAGPTETGIPNITVWLEVDLNNDGTYSRVMTTTTDSNGRYLFTSLPDGKYRVVVDTSDPDLPIGAYGHPYLPSTPTTTDPITLSGGNTYLDADFGFMPPAALGDFVWQDTDGDGNQDAGEPGIPNVRVWLYAWVDENGNGYYDSGDTLSSTPLMTDTTDADGLYLFSGLAAGNYVVRVDTSTLPAGFTQTGDPDWTTVCQGAQCDSASGAALRAGQIDLSRDFGYRPEGVIGDYIWFDSDGDGVQDEGEQGIPYVTVRLCGDADCNTVLMTTQTDSDGYYAFGNLSGGTYYVQVVSSTLPAGLTPTYDKDGIGTPHVAEVTLPSGGSDLTVDFYRYYGAYDISGHVFFDAGNDGGLYNSSVDTPYEGITVYLWRDGRIIGITTTNASGYYVFPDLPNGDYIVSVDRNSPQLAGLTQNTPAPNPPYHRSVTIDNASVPDQDFAAVDYGDLPDTYRTLVASEGAGHIIGGPRLGTGISAEPNGKPSAEALLDTYDDGIAFRDGQLWTPGATVNLTATVSGDNGYLVAWFDWNNDGTFGAGEMVVFGNMVSGTKPLTLQVPSGASTAGYFYIRFRLYDRTTLTTISSSGLARGGEVEDYLHRWQPTAVKLLSFAAVAQPGGILIAWETAGEVDNLGFNLYRRPAGTQSLFCLNEHLIPSIPGRGEGAAYAFLDVQVMAGETYEYFLEDVDRNGNRTQHGPVVARALYTAFLPLVTR